MSTARNYHTPNIDFKSSCNSFTAICRLNVDTVRGLRLLAFHQRPVPLFQAFPFELSPNKSTSQSSNRTRYEGTVVQLHWNSLIIVLRPNGGEDDGRDDVSTPSLLDRADYEHFITKPAQFHSFTPGTRATYELEARSDGSKIAFNIRHKCTDKWEQWERQELEELLLGLSGMR